MCASDRRFAKCRPANVALQASEGRFAKRKPANIALQDTCLLQASESRFARYVPANVAMQASESRSASNMQAKIAHDMNRCYFSNTSFQPIRFLVHSKAIYAKHPEKHIQPTAAYCNLYAKHSCKRISIPQSELCTNCTAQAEMSTWVNYCMCVCVCACWSACLNICVIILHVLFTCG